MPRQIRLDLTIHHMSTTCLFITRLLLSIRIKDIRLAGHLNDNRRATYLVPGRLLSRQMTTLCRALEATLSSKATDLVHIRAVDRHSVLFGSVLVDTEVDSISTDWKPHDIECRVARIIKSHTHPERHARVSTWGTMFLPENARFPYVMPCFVQAR
ncbi:hypothetical protein AUEXF2481DRAFT_539350 [Aureobasidium subglaciale EXF-2481]|uniref:Uncharacterized protein n=1 Tax=Aureobasidium subglaciale (strain EXF-2481) TaxID=1043005 RepID=A0A074ZGG3_AURSE|nr:uncharacterized protein AUEXF2481DRAFT_539350 [Aureobasidium subglaciale EXF-2481]KEQ97651.1 hypothetical protein AUEXF2481DRAFT_539350 [Aureobasidium subglaciale EXF-2481]